MSREVPPLISKAKKQYVLTLLEEILEPLRVVARAQGYSLAVHGSLSRDIDIVAIPWTKEASGDADKLAEKLCGALLPYFGSACINGKSSDKPHGRKAYVLVMSDSNVYIDLSIMPIIHGEKENENEK